jgi:hypothetical protein
MIEVIVMIGVVGNFVLQLSWFIWTLKNHKKQDFSHKHIENDQNNQNQETIYPKSIVPKSKEEVFSAERKYNPNKIKGQFDSIFEIN